MTPSDPRDILRHSREAHAHRSDAELLVIAATCVERLRSALRSIAPEANISDRFEGVEAAAAIELLRERHG